MASQEKDVWAIDPDSGQKYQLRGPQLEVYEEFIARDVKPGLAAILASVLEAPVPGGTPLVPLGEVLVTTGDAHEIIGCSRPLLQRKSNLRNLPTWWPTFYMNNGDRKIPVWWVGRLRNLKGAWSSPE